MDRCLLLLEGIGAEQHDGGEGAVAVGAVDNTDDVLAMRGEVDLFGGVVTVMWH
ncbi:Uncharacterised protein [Mycobacteroides abscessus subsp. abscessus]|nr:Uncharacterised protein [Mycobacteroides abscessus subsp. abscessus]